jgi:signal transduction histidine kinase
MMPQLTGLDLCRQLRQDDRLREVPVILLSAALPQGYPEAEVFLPKPFELSDFERLVQETLHQRGVSTPEGRNVPVADADHLVHSVAHEIKTPLAAARLNLELLQRNLGLTVPASERSHLNALAEQLAAMEMMVNGLVSASRIAEGGVELRRLRLDLSALVERKVADWRKLRPAGEIRVDMPESTVWVEGDASRLSEVLETLLTSALRFGSPNRSLVLSILPGAGSVTVRLAEIGVNGHDEAVDSGRDPQALSGGQGVALYVASQIARLHGGALAVRSTHGEGAVFSLRLPTAR